MTSQQSFFKQIDPQGFEIKNLFCQEHEDCVIKYCCLECYDDEGCEPWVLCDQCYQDPQNIHVITHKDNIIDLNEFIKKCLICFEDKMKLEQEASKSVRELFEDNLSSMQKQFEQFSEIIQIEKNMVESDFNNLMDELKRLKYLIKKLKVTICEELGNEVEQVYQEMNKLQTLQCKDKCLLFQTRTNNITLRQLYLQIKEMANRRHFSDNSKQLIVLQILLKEFSPLIKNPQPEELKEQQENNENLFKYKMKSLYEQVIVIMENPGQFKGFMDSQRCWDLFIEKLKGLRNELSELGELLLRSGGEPNTYLWQDDSENIQFSCSHFSLLQRNIKQEYEYNGLELQEKYSIKTKHSKGVSCFAVISEKIIVTAGYDYRLKIWDWVNKKCLKEKQIIEIAISLLVAKTKNKKVLVSGHDSGYLLMFEIGSYKVIFMKKIVESKIIGLVEIGDEALIAAGSYDGSVLLFNVITMTIEMKFQGHSEAVNCIDCQKFAHLIATGSDDCTIKIWKIPDQESSPRVKTSLEKSIENQGQKVTALTFLLSNPRILLSACFNKIIAWDISNKECLYSVGKHVNAIYKIIVIEQEQFFGQQNVIYEYVNQISDPVDESYLMSLKDTQSYQSYRMPEEIKDDSSQQQLEVLSPNLVLNNSQNAVDVNKFYILSFGLDHMIKLWNHAISTTKPIFMTKDNLKEFSKVDATGQTFLMYNAKLDVPCFVSTADRDNKLNLWKFKKKVKPQDLEQGVSYQFFEDNLF